MADRDRTGKGFGLAGHSLLVASLAGIVLCVLGYLGWSMARRELVRAGLVSPGAVNFPFPNYRLSRRGSEVVLDVILANGGRSVVRNLEVTDVSLAGVKPRELTPIRFGDLRPGVAESRRFTFQGLKAGAKGMLHVDCPFGTRDAEASVGLRREVVIP